MGQQLGKLGNEKQQQLGNEEQQQLGNEEQLGNGVQQRGLLGQLRNEEQQQLGSVERQRGLLGRQQLWQLVLVGLVLRL